MDCWTTSDDDDEPDAKTTDKAWSGSPVVRRFERQAGPEAETGRVMFTDGLVTCDGAGRAVTRYAFPSFPLLSIFFSRKKFRTGRAAKYPPDPCSLSPDFYAGVGASCWEGPALAWVARRKEARRACGVVLRTGQRRPRRG